MSFFCKHAISQSFKIIFIAILLSIIAVFRINNREVEEVLFLISNLIRSPPRFDVEIFKIINDDVAGCSYTTTH
jgi:hypothetical protein